MENARGRVLRPCLPYTVPGCGARVSLHQSATLRAGWHHDSTFAPGRLRARRNSPAGQEAEKNQNSGVLAEQRCIGFS